MITDKSNGRLDEIKTLAKKNNMLESFNETFSRLESYTDKGYKGKQYYLFQFTSGRSRTKVTMKN